MMSGLWRWGKFRNVVLTTASTRVSSSHTPKRGFVNINAGVDCPYIRRRSLIGAQARYIWEHGGGGGGFDDNNSKMPTMIRRIKAEANCPRCCNKMDLVFSDNRHLIPPLSVDTTPTDEWGDPSAPSSDTDKKGTNPTVSLCPNCKSTYHFQPYQMSPLQGKFVEIGRFKKGNGKDKKHINGEEDYVNKLQASFWGTLRTYGGGPPENWTNRPPPPPSNTGIAVYTPPDPPYAPDIDSTCEGGPVGGEKGKGGGGEKNYGWGGSNLVNIVENITLRSSLV